MEHRVTYTVAELGFDESNGERVLEAFLHIAPEVGPVVSQNVVRGTLDVTIALDADQGLEEAMGTGASIFRWGMAEAGAPNYELVGVTASSVEPEPEDVPAPDRDRTPQPA